MTSSETRKPSYSRRMMWLAVFVAVLFGGYSAGWFYVGKLLQDQVKTALADANAKGVSADCANPTARGFPFRIGLFCDAVSFDSRKGASVSAGAFRSAAQVYNPFHIIAELDGPAVIDAAGTPPLRFNWEGLRASVRLAAPLPERISVEGTDVAAGPASGQPLAKAASVQGHMRPNGADLDVAGSVGNLVADASVLQGRVVPPLSAEVDATVTNGVALLQLRPKSLRGQSAIFRTLTISTDASTGVGIAGPVSVDEAGLIDADLTLTVRNAKGLAEAAATAFPEARDRIEKAMIGIGMLGQNTSLPLKIVKGKASLGFIGLGDIPPVK
ncbi:MAG: DUF2125 domain-containing protein [Hyphomicrobiales bacterium]|nr:DUF2125 domain-containing protein [Hyphomicrobiales bacterium]